MHMKMMCLIRFRLKFKYPEYFYLDENGAFLLARVAQLDLITESERQPDLRREKTEEIIIIFI